MVNEILAIFDKKHSREWNISDETIGIGSKQSGEFAHISVIPDACIDGEVQWEVLAQYYGTGDNKGVYIGFESDGSPRKDNSPPWQEINFGSADPEIIRSWLGITRISVSGMKLDSYTIQAQRRKILPVKDSDVTENAVQGILHDGGQFMLGVRGGQDQPGKLNVLPGGSVAYKNNYYKYNPFIDAFNDECWEEAGAEIYTMQLKGIFNQKGVHTNRQFVFTAQITQSIEEIVENHRKGFELYARTKAETGDELKARRVLAESKYPADAWETRKIIVLPYDADTFLKLLSDEKWKHTRGEPAATLIGTLPATLYVVGTVDFGKDFKRAADKLPLVQKEIMWKK